MPEPILTIGGVSFSNQVDVFSIQIQDTAPAEGDQLSFTLRLTDTELDGSPGVPQPGEIVSMTVNNSKEFEGVLLSVNQVISTSREVMLFQCSAGDYTYLLGAKLVTGKIGAGRAGEIIKSLVQQYAPNFGTRFVRSGFDVPEEELDHAQLTGVIDKYAQSIGFSWYVDFNRQVHFSEGEVRAGPIATLNLDTDNRVSEVAITEDASQLRNRVYVKDATARSAERRTDTFTAADNQSFFKLFTNPFSSEGASVLVNNEERDVLEDTLTSQDGELTGSSGVCFFCSINSGVRFPLSDLPAEGNFVEVNYFPEDSGGDSVVVVLEDPDSIRMMRQRESTTGFLSDGIHEHIVSAPQLRVASLDPLAYLGGIVLDRMAWPEIKGTFIVSDQSVRGWKPGMSVILSSSKRNLYNAKTLWREGRFTDVKVFVQSVSKTFRPYRKADLTFDQFFVEDVEFSSLPARLGI